MLNSTMLGQGWTVLNENVESTSVNRVAKRVQHVEFNNAGPMFNGVKRDYCHETRSVFDYFVWDQFTIKAGPGA